QRFHAAFSGWTFRPAFAGTELRAEYWIIEQNDHGIGGLQRADDASPPPSAGTRVYLPVDDLEDALARALSLGGAVERARTALGGDDRWCGIFGAPAGVPFGGWTERPLG